MVMLVTLDQASEHLRRDSADDDNDLILKIEAASEAVINYLKDGATFLDTSGEVVTDTSGPIGVPKVVKSATLLMIGYLYKDRDTNTDKEYQQGYLPAPVTALLYPLRTPAMA